MIVIIASKSMLLDSFYRENCGVEIEADKLMISWFGHGGNHINIGLPHYVAMDRKPNNSRETQNLADVSSGFIIFFEVVISANKEEAIKKDLELDP